MNAHLQNAAIESEAKPLHRRWFRFSLRTMLIVVTIIAVVFGIWIDRSKRQANAVTKLRELLSFQDNLNGPMTGSGFRYSCDPSFEQNPRNLFAKSWVPPTLLNNIGIDYFHTVDGVSVERVNRYAPIDGKVIDSYIDIAGGQAVHDIEKEDHALEYLRRLPHLKSFTSNYLTGNLKDGKNNLFEIVGAMSGLEELHLGVGYYKNPYSIQKKDILNLCKLQHLKKFSILEIQIDSDDDLIAFSELSRLTCAYIRLSKQTTLKGFQSLKKLENINDFQITFDNEITKEHIDLLAHSFPKLNRLMLNSLSNSEILEPLLKHPTLTTLHFTDPNITGVCVVTMPTPAPPISNLNNNAK